MDNNKKLNDFTTYSNSYNAAMVTNDVPKMQAAIDDIFGMLTPEEEKIYDETVSKKLNFNERITV